MSKAQNIANVLRTSLRRLGHHYRGERVGIALSGGIDSCTVLAGLLSAGVQPVVVSYTPSTHDSIDYQYAQRNANQLGLPFHRAVYEMTYERFLSSAREIVRHGYRSKLEVECLSPMLRVLQVARCAGVEYLFTGDQADGYYINNNWMARNYDRARGIPGPLRQHVKYDDTSDRIDALRRIYYEEDRSCSRALYTLGQEHGVTVVTPYRSTIIRDVFNGSHWRDVNEPRLKEPAWLAWPDYLNVLFEVRSTPANLHRGDTRFAETMGRVLMENIPGPWRTPTGLYSALAKGEA